jgi:SAM-dependent methyltransferase
MITRPAQTAGRWPPTSTMTPSGSPPTSWRPRTSRLLATCMIGWPIDSPRSRTVLSLILVAGTALSRSRWRSTDVAPSWLTAPSSSAAPRVPAVRADAIRLPFRAECFAAVAALWMLYYLDRPAVALMESARVLRPGGTFVGCTSSRYNDPEFASVLPQWGEPLSFDAETAPEIISDHFTITEVVTWDAPAVRLPDGAAVALFLRGRGLSADEASLQAGRWKVPLSVTKRGCLIWARRD